MSYARHVITTTEELREIVPPPRPAQETKVLSPWMFTAGDGLNGALSS